MAVHRHECNGRDIANESPMTLAVCRGVLKAEAPYLAADSMCNHSNMARALHTFRALVGVLSLSRYEDVMQVKSAMSMSELLPHPEVLSLVVRVHSVTLCCLGQLHHGAQGVRDQSLHPQRRVLLQLAGHLHWQTATDCASHTKR